MAHRICQPTYQSPARKTKVGQQFLASILLHSCNIYLPTIDKHFTRGPKGVNTPAAKILDDDTHFRDIAATNLTVLGNEVARGDRGLDILWDAKRIRAGDPRKGFSLRRFETVPWSPLSPEYWSSLRRIGARSHHPEQCKPLNGQCLFART